MRGVTLTALLRRRIKARALAKGDILSVTTEKKIQGGSYDKLYYGANGRAFERAQFVASNKGHWCSAVWAHCPMAV